MEKVHHRSKKNEGSEDYQDCDCACKAVVLMAFAGLAPNVISTNPFYVVLRATEAERSSVTLAALLVGVFHTCDVGTLVVRAASVVVFSFFLFLYFVAIVVLYCRTVEAPVPSFRPEVLDC